MEIRYRYVFAIITLLINQVQNDEDTKPTEHDMSTCPFSKIIEDIFKIQNTSKSVFVKDRERTKLFLNTIANFTSSDKKANTSSQEDLVNKIIASINKIKNNITTMHNDADTNLNEAIILNTPTEHIANNINDIKNKTLDQIKKNATQIKSGIEEKIDVVKLVNATKKNKLQNNKTQHDKITSTTEKVNYVEILTIEPNNTSASNTSSHNIIDVLKQLMPMFNSTLTKELHNITIIERNHLKNHSFTATKNVSTIVVTYCDKENLTKANMSTSDNNMKDTDLKVGDNEYDYYANDDGRDDDALDYYDDDKPDANLTRGEKKDILEAAEYGMQKMHELYSILEPKLYSMGLWLDDTNPARYVAAFNAPTEDAARFYRYGYASLQAATRLKQLSRSVIA